MLLAMVAFVTQGAMIAASQALASAGSMSDPAVTLDGPVHYHNNLAGHVHVHGGQSAAGHVHNIADVNHDDIDDDHMPFWSIGCTSAVLPVMAICTVSFGIVTAGERSRADLKGVDPDGLNRPPSTPCIA